jgi:dTDP-4-amino-4,6-dideoxygalactose transaminase
LQECLKACNSFSAQNYRLFEKEFAAYCTCSYGVGVASGTDALALALRACDIGPGDEVITVANTFIATIEAIDLVGAIPVFVDVDPITYTMDWQQLESVLTSRTRAVLPVHLYGHPTEMQPLLDFAHAHGLHIIEDASQAHGTTYQGRRVGSFGDIGCFSLYYSKNLGAYGEAGICVTNDESLAERLYMLRDHGSRIRYRHEILGVNGRLDELQAAILRIKLRYLDQWNAARSAHAKFYTEQLRTLDAIPPQVAPWATHTYCYYVVQVPKRDHFRHILEQEGIATGIHYPIPAHLQPACARYGYTRGTLSMTEALAERIVSLPLYPELTEEQRQTVIDTSKKALS